jgi:hypothetical protein
MHEGNRDFVVNMMLADSAQLVHGKLYVLGGGWDACTSACFASVVVLVRVPWYECNKKHRWELILEDADGMPIVVRDEKGSIAPIRLEAPFELGRPPGVSEGAQLNLPIVVNLPPLSLTEGVRYAWRFLINGEGHSDWMLSFMVRGQEGGLEKAG